MSSNKNKPFERSNDLENRNINIKEYPKNYKSKYIKRNNTSSIKENHLINRKRPREFIAKKPKAYNNIDKLKPNSKKKNMSSSKKHDGFQKEQRTVDSSFHVQTEEYSIFLLINFLSLGNRTKYELMLEAFYIGNLFFIMNKTNWNSQDDMYYVINMSWFEKWKNYVNYDYYMDKIEKFLNIQHNDTTCYNLLSNEVNKAKDDEYLNEISFFKNSDDFIKEEIVKYFHQIYLASNASQYPDQINNKLLLYEKGTYFYDLNNTNNILNYNIKEKFVDGIDFFIVTKPIWEYFQRIYGGHEIKRYNIEVCKNEFLIEVKFKTVYNLNYSS